MARPERVQQKQNREEMVAKILAAAEEIFAEFGFVGASISKIAAKAGIAKSNVIYYFETKELLYKNVVQDMFEVWRTAAFSLDADRDPAEALRTYIEVKMDLARSRPSGSKVWANEIIQGAPIVQDYLESELKRWTDDRIAVMNAWIATGRMRAIDPRNLLYAIWAVTQHYADFRHQIATLNSGNELSDEQWASAKKNVTEILLRGILK